MKDSTVVGSALPAAGRASRLVFGVLVCAALAALSSGCDRSEPPLRGGPQATAAPLTAAPSQHDAASAAVRLPLRLQLAPDGFRAESGHAWIVTLPPEWAPFSSNVNALERSRLKLTEDGVALGPRNANHDEIREEGRGAYSHWTTALYFSTSDNSDPRENGHTYVVELPAGDD